MKPKRIFAFFLMSLLFLFCCGCSATSSGLSMLNHKKITELTLKGETYWAAYQEHQEVGEAISIVDYQKPLSYVLQYPQTGHTAIDDRIEGIVTEIRNAFDQEFLPGETPAGETDSGKKTEAVLYLGYESYLTDNDQMSLVFFETHETADTLSPHTRIQIFHFDLSSDTEIPAEELMWEDFAKNASAYTQKYFTTTEPYNEGLFGNYATLLAPDAGRFDRFAFTAEGVLFYFDRYDLFPGSYGIVRLTIPYEDMRTKIETPKEEIFIPTEISHKKMVALTYDDGPNPIATNAILDTLEQYGARATFFDLGCLVEKYPDVVKREAALGCEVGSHSYDHKNFSKLTAAEISADLQKTAAAFQKALGKDPAVFRPPYGACDENVKKQISMPIYLWSIDTLDWKSRNAKAVLDVVKSSGDLDGKVILLHGIYTSTAEATAVLVPYLQGQGYELVTVSELIQAKHGETPASGKIYGYSYFQ
ncbi:polysaccharide deacetylase family protein [Anaerotignum sp.]